MATSIAASANILGPIGGRACLYQCHIGPWNKSCGMVLFIYSFWFLKLVVSGLLCVGGVEFCVCGNPN